MLTKGIFVHTREIIMYIKSEPKSFANEKVK